MPILIAAVGLIVFLVVSNTVDFKSQLFTNLFPRKDSFAEEERIDQSQKLSKLLTETRKEYVFVSGKLAVPYSEDAWVLTAENPKKITLNLSSELGLAKIEIEESDLEINTLVDYLSKGSISREDIKFEQLSGQKFVYKEITAGQISLFQKFILKGEDGISYLITTRFSEFDDSYKAVNALLNELNFNVNKQGVKGAITGDNLSVIKLIELVRPSVVNVIHLYCYDIKIAESAKLKNLKPEYSFCSGTKGTGFIVDDSGVVVTNGHVAKPFPEEALAQNLSSPILKMFVEDFVSENLYHQVTENPNQMGGVIFKLFSLIDQKLVTISQKDSLYFVNVGKVPSNINYEKLGKGNIEEGISKSETTLRADLIAIDYANPYSLDKVLRQISSSGSDIAILKLVPASGIKLPSLKLGDSLKVKEGQEIVVVGYPTLVEGGEQPESLISYDTSINPTITRGIISSIKLDKNGRKLLQTDAGIESGNSGGPAFNPGGEVIGVATFALDSSSGNFNFLRNTADVNQLLAENKIDISSGDMSENWTKGLENYWNGYYKRSLKNFQTVVNLNPSHPTVYEFISSAEKAIKNGEDRENWFNNLLYYVDIFGEVL